MKMTLFAFAVILLCIKNFEPLYAQKIDNFKPKVFSLHNAKFSLGLGIDGSFSNWSIKASQPGSMKVAYKDPRKDSTQVSYVAAGISFDFYSPNSLMGIIFGCNYSFSDLAIADANKSEYNYFSINRLDFPAYLRIRPGSRDANAHLLILIGAVFNLPIKGTRTILSNGSGGFYVEDSTDNSKSQFKSFLSLSASLGIEFFEGKKNNSRMTGYINCDYPLGNALNEDYADFKPGGNSTLTNFNKFKIQQFRFGIGLRYFIGFRKYKDFK